MHRFRRLSSGGYSRTAIITDIRSFEKYIIRYVGYKPGYICPTRLQKNPSKDPIDSRQNARFYGGNELFRLLDGPGHSVMMRVPKVVQLTARGGDVRASNACQHSSLQRSFHWGRRH
jgi:hypothetical protein